MSDYSELARAIMASTAQHRQQRLDQLTALGPPHCQVVLPEDNETLCAWHTPDAVVLCTRTSAGTWRLLSFHTVSLEYASAISAAFSHPPTLGSRA